ncbi:MAG: DUF1549 domain-containing protein [Pirellulaceae bacterium]
MIYYGIYLLALVGAAPTEPVHFDTQIVPVLTKAGCNAGACHGAAVGRGGFKLSLYGGDPAVDYDAIVRQVAGRRINLARPASSLLLLKPTGILDHGGGYRLDADKAGAQRLLRWIESGAQRGPPRRLVRFKVFPTDHLAGKPGEQLKLRAEAEFADGQVADVTDWTVFEPEDSSAVEVDPTSSQVTLLRRGRHVVVARFLDRVVPLQFTVPLSDQAVTLPVAKGENFIDRHVRTTLEQLRLPVSPMADDATLVRRLYLDLIGRLPTEAESLSYLKDGRSGKRLVLIDRLLKSAEASDYWTFQFAKLLRIRSRPQDTLGAQTYHGWLRQQIQQDASYAQMARTMLTTTGDSHKIGPANFYRSAGDPRARAEFVSELFMGVRLRCANCHNHPLDQWTQDDYHGLSAIFAPLQVGRVVSVKEHAEVTHPRTGEAAVPRIPGTRFLESAQAGRELLADWLTDRQNPYFAPAAVNRLWKNMMGRGLVEPTDDMRSTNPATHPKLLKELARQFSEHDYSWRYVVRTIASSQTYARSAQPLPANRADDRFYSHALVRPLEAEVLSDALVDVTGVPHQYGDFPLGTRAVTLFDSLTPSAELDILGRCSREESCEVSSSSRAAGGLTRKLHLMNGRLVNSKIRSKKSHLSKFLDSQLPYDQIVSKLYLSCFSRYPTEPEREYWQQQEKQVQTGQQRRELLEDLFWSLLACREFTTNH